MVGLNRTNQAAPACWLACSNFLYLCSAYRKLYRSLLYCIFCCFFFCSSFTAFIPLFCLSSCWMVWSRSLQGRALTCWRLKQLPRQEVQRALHICFDIGVKGKEAPILHFVLTNCHTLWFYCSGIFFHDFPFKLLLGNTP